MILKGEFALTASCTSY